MITSRGTWELLSAHVQQLNQSTNPSATLSDKSHHIAWKPPTSFMLRKRKNLGHEKLTEPCTEPSRRPGRNNICFTTTPFSCPPLLLLQKTANKTLEVAFRKEKTFILLVHGLKIIMSLWLLSRKKLRRHIPVPHLYWNEQGYLLLGPMNRGPAKTTAIPGLATEHWWIAKVGTAPGGVFTNPTLYFTVYDPTTATPRPSLLFLW